MKRLPRKSVVAALGPTGPVRRVLAATALAVMASVLASAQSTSGPFTTTTPVAATTTNWTGSLTFPQFNPALGTLTKVTLDLSSAMSSTITVTNNAASGSSGTDNTEIYVAVEDAGNHLGFQYPPNITDATPTLDITTGTYNYNLAAGGQSTSAPLTGNGDTGALAYTLPAILAEFTGAGNVTLTAGTFTLTNFSNTGGNSTDSQITQAGLTGTVTYTYTPPLLSITKLPASATVAAGLGGSFTLQVSNAGTVPTTTSTVTVTDTVPAPLTIGAVTSAGNAWNCGVVGQLITCTITQVVAAGGNFPAITVPYTVPAGTAPQTVFNTATVTGGGDPTPGGHTSLVAQVTVPGTPLLSITKLPASVNVAAGGNGSFTLQVSNSNTATASTAGQTTVTDPVPVPLTIGAVTSAGNAWNCGVVGQLITCTITQVVAAGAIFRRSRCPTQCLRVPRRRR